MWRSNRLAMEADLPSEPGSPAETTSPRPPTGPSARRKLALRFAAFMRWLHIYLSMFGLGTLLFFSITGITLNHPDWFPSGPESSTESRGRMRTDWLHRDPRDAGSADLAEEAASPTVDKLAVVEYLRAVHGIHRGLADFQIDEQECVVTFKGAGYAADAFIERESGEYRIIETRQGLISILNDLHKGRDTGQAWSWVIDISAGMLSFSSFTGLILLLYIKRRRRLGLVTGIFGAIVLAAIAYYFVP